MAPPARLFYVPHGPDGLMAAGAVGTYTVDPPVHDKTALRDAAASTRILARNSGNEVAVEFNVSAFRKKYGRLPGRADGIAFRGAMKTAKLPADVIWAVQEFPSGTRSKDPTVRRALGDLVGGLHDGAAGDPPMPGIVFQEWPGPPRLSNRWIAKRRAAKLAHWQKDEVFWAAMKRCVRWYAVEVYVSPRLVLKWKAPRLRSYLFEAVVGLPTTHPLRDLFVPLISAVWGAKGGYGYSEVPLGVEKRAVRKQIRAIRATPRSQTAIGVAFDDAAPYPAAERELLAAAIVDALS